MKRWFTPLYWSAAVPLVALVLWSAMGSLPRAFFLVVVMLLPGVLFFKYFVGDISYKNRRQGILHTIYFVAVVMLIEYLGIFFVYVNVEYPSNYEPPHIVTNPLFIWLLLGALLSIEYFLKSRFGNEEQPRQKFITFTSDRRRTMLEVETILYIESRDDEVTVVTADGAKHPTRMKISQWEAALDDRFMRVHRSFIVSRLHITRIDAHSVWLGERHIEISRKYRENYLKERK